MLQAQRWFRLFITWFAGNVLWGITTYIFTRVAENSAMMELVAFTVGLIGFLVLIVVGLVYIMFREKDGKTATAQYEQMAKYVTMMFLAQEYEVSPRDLADLNNPQAMEERAKRIKVERELSSIRIPKAT